MCSQFSIKSRPEKIAEELGISLQGEFSKAERYFPFSPGVPVVVKSSNGVPAIVSMRYSLTPSWSKDLRPKFGTHNARLTRVNPNTQKLEKIYEVPSWKGSFGKKHCLVPMTDFFESIRNKEFKCAGNMVDFSKKDHSLFYAAGIWNDWIDQNSGEVAETFAIVTTDPPSLIASVGHDRCPIFLSPSDGLEWARRSWKNPAEAFDFLVAHQFVPDFEVSIDRPLKEGWDCK